MLDNKNLSQMINDYNFTISILKFKLNFAALTQGTCILNLCTENKDVSNRGGIRFNTLGNKWQLP